jgi:hypothetical protein
MEYAPWKVADNLKLMDARFFTDQRAATEFAEKAV